MNNFYVANARTGRGPVNLFGVPPSGGSAPAKSNLGGAATPPYRIKFVFFPIPVASCQQNCFDEARANNSHPARSRVPGETELFLENVSRRQPIFTRLQV